MIIWTLYVHVQERREAKHTNNGP